MEETSGNESNTERKEIKVKTFRNEKVKAFSQDALFKSIKGPTKKLVQKALSEKSAYRLFLLHFPVLSLNL